MSDWEEGARNAIKIVYPSIALYGCWFHYNQAVWRKISKLGLVTEFILIQTSKKILNV